MPWWTIMERGQTFHWCRTTKMCEQGNTTGFLCLYFFACFFKKLDCIYNDKVYNSLLYWSYWILEQFPLWVLVKVRNEKLSMHEYYGVYFHFRKSTSFSNKDLLKILFKKAHDPHDLNQLISPLSKFFCIIIIHKYSSACPKRQVPASVPGRKVCVKI